MSHQTEYDLRMRSYKSITDAHLIPRTPVIIQIDGRAFHTFTRGFKKPFDQVLMAAMRYTAEYLCRNIQGCVLAYTQSDEINLLLIDYEKLETSPWFDNRVQKLASIAASMATNYFNQKFKELVKIIGRRYYSPNHSYDRALLKGADAYSISHEKKSQTTLTGDSRMQFVTLFKWLVKHIFLRPN